MEPVNEENLLRAARLTVAFLFLYMLTFFNILKTKNHLIREASLHGKIFDRYSCPQMQTADRLMGNFLEWSPIYLGLVWSLAATGNWTRMTIAAAWGYIGLRGIYMVLLLQHGVAANGRNKSLWISTFPSYACLLWMMIHAIWRLWFTY